MHKGVGRYGWAVVVAGADQRLQMTVQCDSSGYERDIMCILYGRHMSFVTAALPLSEVIWESGAACNAQSLKQLCRC